MSAGSKRRGFGGQRAKNEADESVRQAIERAVHHAGLALAEGASSARALLDAASIGVTGDAAETHPGLSDFAQALDQMSEALSGETSSLGSTALSALLTALDREIGRWEKRSQTDDDARAVLRAFLGLREFLWELGVRPKPGTKDPESVEPDTRRSSTRRKSGKTPEAASADEAVHSTPRVQRIKIEG